MTTPSPHPDDVKEAESPYVPRKRSSNESSPYHTVTGPDGVAFRSTDYELCAIVSGAMNKAHAIALALAARRAKEWQAPHSAINSALAESQGRKV